MTRIKTWLTWRVVIMMLRGEAQERHHPAPVDSENALLVAERLESLPLLEHHPEHIHEEVLGSAERVSGTAGHVESVRLSVVAPLYNQGNGISAWWQARAAFWNEGAVEAILVDDGSPDDSATRLSAVEGAVVKAVRLGKNHGYSQAARRGLDRATGDYVAIADFETLKAIGTFEPLLDPLQSGSAELAVIVQPSPRRKSRWRWAWLSRLLVMVRLRVVVTDMYPVCWAVRGRVAKRLARELAPGELFSQAVHWVVRSGGVIKEVPFDLCRTPQGA